MLYTLAVILLIAWLLGIVGTYTIGAFVHVLLVLAIVLLVMGLLTGRRPVHLVGVDFAGFALTRLNRRLGGTWEPASAASSPTDVGRHVPPSTHSFRGATVSLLR